MVHALLVDDKNNASICARTALIRAGFQNDEIHDAVCGDDAIEKYKALKSHGISFELVLSDYHMDPQRKPPEGTSTI